MKRIHFFALREDLLPMLEAVEAGGPLKYIRCGHYPAGAAVEVLSAGSEIPSLGRATTYNASTSETFVVSEPEAVIALRPIGTDRVSVDQLLNPYTVTFTPSGIWNDDIVLYGRVATVSDSGPAQKLMRRFHAAMKKRFTKMEEYYVGPHALALLKAGKRLAIGAYSPRDSDLHQV